MGQLVSFIIFPVDMNVDLCLSSYCLGRTRCISVNVVIYLFASNSACQSQNWSRNVPNVKMTKVFCVSPQDIHCVYYITLATLYNNIVHLKNTCVTFFFYVRNDMLSKPICSFHVCNRDRSRISSAYAPNLYDVAESVPSMLEGISGKIS